MRCIDNCFVVQAIKALQDKLAETRAAVEPRPKFSFKTKKNTSAISLSDAAELAAQGYRGVPGYRSPGTSSVSSSANQTPNYPSTPLNEPDRILQQHHRPEVVPTSVPAVSVGNTEDYTEPEQKTSAFAANVMSSVSVNNHHDLHILLPSSGSTASVPASITSLNHCVVDMSIPTANGKPYASLTAKDIQESLLVCGQIQGPAHITGVQNSVIVVSCRQFRMHDCKNVDVYLSSSSNPIIEGCTNIRFGRTPRAYVSIFLSIFLFLYYKPNIYAHLQALDHDRPDHEDRWCQVEDFEWIKPEPSPNWSLLSPDDAVPEGVWAEIVPGGPGWSLDDILRAINLA